jgi:phosphinothricin acetyltransferase
MTAKIRFAEPRDAEAILRIYTPYCESTAVSFETHSPSVEEMTARIARIAPKYPWLVCDIDGHIAGYVYACQHRERAAYRWSVDVTVYVDSGRHRQGIGRALYTTLISLLRQQGYLKAYAGITLPNPASVGVHEAMGFVPVAVYRGVGYKLGQWRDVGWWQLDLLTEPDNPPEPRPICKLFATPQAALALAEGEKLLGA